MGFPGELSVIVGDPQILISSLDLSRASHLAVLPSPLTHTQLVDRPPFLVFSTSHEGTPMHPVFQVVSLLPLWNFSTLASPLDPTVVPTLAVPASLPQSSPASLALLD